MSPFYGDPNSSFGETIFVSLQELPKLLNSCSVSLMSSVYKSQFAMKGRHSSQGDSRGAKGKFTVTILKESCAILEDTGSVSGECD